MNVIFKYVLSPVANLNLLIISKNRTPTGAREINLTPRPHQSKLVKEIAGIDLNNLEAGYFYLLL